MTDGPRSPEPPSGPPPESDVERKPLRRRVTGTWNKLGLASKAGVIGVAAAVVGGVIAVAHARATAVAADDEESGGILAEVARILDQATAEQDDNPSLNSPPHRPPHIGDVSGYRRFQCLNPRGHATGNCRHELRWVDAYTKGAAEEEDAEV
ncbi:hypothetical protein ACFWM0_02965 [Streptomyces sp. NPDC058405]|uniref:hypothetical protein n=1 Tax=Streptomyces sp. NPDC058405 TaxID=3346482 RepID=UPI003657065B